MTNDDIYRLLLIILLLKNGDSDVSSVNEAVITALLLSSCSQNSRSQCDCDRSCGCGCNTSF